MLFRHTTPRSTKSARRFTVESLETRELLAYGDSFLDLYNIDRASPHADFTFLLDSEPNNTNSQANPTGLTSSTDNAVIIEGDLSQLQTKDIFKFNASKGDMIAVFVTSERFLPIAINGTALFGDLIGRPGTFRGVYNYRAPFDGEHFLAVGPSLLGYYGIGLAIARNLPVVAQLSGPSGPLATTVNTPITLSDASYDPEEKAIGKIPGITGIGDGITQRTWSGGGGTGRSATYTFPQPGTYSINLDVRSNDGEVASVSRDIVVSGPDLPTGHLTSLRFVEGATMRAGGAINVLPDPGVVDARFDDDPREWDYLDTNFDGNSEEEQPVLYVAGSVPVVNADFTMPSGATGKYFIQGEATDPKNPLKRWTFEGSANVTNGRLTVTAPATTGFGETVNKYDQMVIQWKMKPEAGEWKAAGSSRNTVYVCAAPPDTRDLYETIVDLAIINNLGNTSQSETLLINGSFSPFRTDRGVANVIKRVRDSVVLKYYGGYFTDPNIPPPIPYSANETVIITMLLQSADGRCDNWTELFRAVLGVNGLKLKSSAQYWEPDNPREYYVLDNWRFTNEARFDNTWYFLGENINQGGMVKLGPVRVDGSTLQLPTIVELPGLYGQGRVANPAKIHKNHAVVHINGYYYDPSYGTDPIADTLGKKHWEQNFVAGYAKSVLTNAQRAWGNSPVASEAISGNDWNKNQRPDVFKINKSVLIVRPNILETPLNSTERVAAATPQRPQHYGVLSESLVSASEVASGSASSGPRIVLTPLRTTPIDAHSPLSVTMTRETVSTSVQQGERFREDVVTSTANKNARARKSAAQSSSHLDSFGLPRSRVPESQQERNASKSEEIVRQNGVGVMLRNLVTRLIDVRARKL